MTQATLTDTDDTDRPDDCECMQFPNSGSDLACWNCYDAGFEDVNPNAPVWEPEETTA